MPRKKSAYKMPKMELNPTAMVAVGTLISFILAGLSLVSVVTTHTALYFWRSFLYESIGWTFVFSPIIFLLIGLVLQKVKWRFGQMNVLVGLIVCVIALSSLTAAFQPSLAGGLGELLWTELSGFITPMGTIFTLMIVFLIGWIVLFNTSFESLVNMVMSVGGIFKPLGGVLGIFNREKSVEFKNPSIKLSGVDEEYVAPRQNKPNAAPSRTNRDDIVPVETVVANAAGGPTRVWKYPPLNLLSDKAGTPADRGDVKKSASIIERALESFNIQARVAEVNGGPAVTQYALEIPSGTKIAKISNLQNDIALALATRTGTVRIEAPIPGKSLIGIEVPNHSLEVVTLKSILAHQDMNKHKSKLAIALGKDTASRPVIVEIDRMPHCLIAGTTGSGKSVMMHNFISSLLFRNSPAELKMIMIDPKRVEFTNYNGIPHLLSPVIVEPEKIVSALKWAMAEMDRRYKLLQQVGVRNIASYNELSGFQAMPYIVIFIDELADLMMFAPVEVEDAITRLAQLARAVGIHLVVATQRPSVDVITGLMKANIPCRIAFNVSSMIDSRVIIDGPGAEKLLGRGDMLFMPPDASKPMRVQGVFLADGEINNLVTYLKSQGIEPQYSADVTEMPVGKGGKGGGMSGGADDRDDLFEEAVRTVCQYDRASASLLQRRLRIGYARAARILDELEAAGVVGPGEGAKPREVIVRNPDQFLNGGGESGGRGGEPA